MSPVESSPGGQVGEVSNSIKLQGAHSSHQLLQTIWGYVAFCLIPRGSNRQNPSTLSCHYVLSIGQYNRMSSHPIWELWTWKKHKAITSLIPLTHISCHGINKCFGFNKWGTKIVSIIHVNCCDFLLRLVQYKHTCASAAHCKCWLSDLWSQCWPPIFSYCATVEIFLNMQQIFSFTLQMDPTYIYSLP